GRRVELPDGGGSRVDRRRSIGIEVARRPVLGPQRSRTQRERQCGSGSLSDHSAISCLAEKLGIRKSICAPYRAQLQCSVSESVLGMAAVIQWRGGERTAADL